MNQINKIVFWTAVVFIGLWLIMPLIRWLMDLEFATNSFKSNYKEFLFFFIPIAILLTLFGTIKNKDKGLIIAGKVIGTIVAAATTVFIMFMSIFGDMCAWINRQELYEHKNDSNTKIMVRDFGCGATDSSPPTVGIYKVRYFTKYFIRSTKIDTATIDKYKWIRIE